MIGPLRSSPLPMMKSLNSNSLKRYGQKVKNRRSPSETDRTKAKIISAQTSYPICVTVSSQVVESSNPPLRCLTFTCNPESRTRRDDNPPRSRTHHANPRSFSRSCAVARAPRTSMPLSFGVAHPHAPTDGRASKDVLARRSSLSHSHSMRRRGSPCSGAGSGRSGGRGSGVGSGGPSSDRSG